jgi:hypothetical protein
LQACTEGLDRQYFVKVRVVGQARVLYRVELANFYSIRDPQVIDLRAASNAPDEPRRLIPVWPGAVERVPKVVALFGANASGKSNVLKALSFLTWFARDSFQAAPDSWMPYQRFNDEEMLSAPTDIVTEFSGPSDLDQGDEDCRYRYHVSLGGPKDKPTLVFRETLSYWPPPTTPGTRLVERRLFERSQSVCTASKAFSLRGHRRSLDAILRPNASVISTLAQLKHPFATRLWQAAARISTNILIEKQELNDDFAARYYQENPDLLRLLNHDIERLGLGVRSIELRQGGNGPVAWFEHEGLAGPVPTLFESHGTRLFVRIFPYIARALLFGGVAVIDELDLAIHPLVLPEIIRWFHDPARNPYNAQLWMTCQNAPLLEELIKEEVLFCEKDKSGRTTVYSLRDVQAVRRNDNYYRKYLGGVYGAVPHLG